MRRPLLLACLACGCTVDVGAGRIAPVRVEQEVDLAQALGSPSGSGALSFSTEQETELLSADDAETIDRQYGGQIHAVQAIDLQLQELTVRRADGTIPAGLTLTVALDGVPLLLGRRVRLPSEATEGFKRAVHAHEAWSLPVQYWLTLPIEDAESVLTACASVQPILVVNALEAL
jgi:hypothetical protein